MNMLSSGILHTFFFTLFGEYFCKELDPFQRSVLGFPPINSPYWTNQTIDLVERRYGGMMDMEPYKKVSKLEIELISNHLSCAVEKTSKS